jgi:hypothetical protein
MTDRADTIAAKVEAFIRNEVIPYEKDPRTRSEWKPIALPISISSPLASSAEGEFHQRDGRHSQTRPNGRDCRASIIQSTHGRPS